MKIWLKAKTGLIETYEDSKLNIQDKLRFKETTKELPIGEKYLEIVKNTLMQSRI